MCIVLVMHESTSSGDGFNSPNSEGKHDLLPNSYEFRTIEVRI